MHFRFFGGVGGGGVKEGALNNRSNVDTMNLLQKKSISVEYILL